jgi:hypothetical protein
MFLSVHLVGWMKCDELGWDGVIPFFIVLVGSRLSALGTSVKKSGINSSPKNHGRAHPTLLSVLFSKRLVIFSILY